MDAVGWFHMLFTTFPGRRSAAPGGEKALPCGPCPKGLDSSTVGRFDRLFSDIRFLTSDIGSSPGTRPPIGCISLSDPP
jgi:hypothetical protein